MQTILERLAEHYKDARPELNFNNPYELLVATILSAQCTDVRVNKVTPELFSTYPTPQDMQSADSSTLENIIRPCGCYKVKSKNLIGSAKRIVENYGGKVPQSMDELTTLPGVGRKTANVVLSNAFGLPGLAVDTHVHRVSNRTGLTISKNPEETERQLCSLIPKELWGSAHHWILFHGRYICKAVRPNCSQCFLSDICKEFCNKTELVE